MLEEKEMHAAGESEIYPPCNKKNVSQQRYLQPI